MFDKDTIARDAKIDKEDIIFACSAGYFGGILKYPKKETNGITRHNKRHTDSLPIIQGDVYSSKSKRYK